MSDIIKKALEFCSADEGAMLRPSTLNGTFVASQGCCLRFPKEDAVGQRLNLTVINPVLPENGAIVQIRRLKEMRNQIRELNDLRLVISCGAAADAWVQERIMELDFVAPTLTALGKEAMLPFDLDNNRIDVVELLEDLDLVARHLIIRSIALHKSVAGISQESLVSACIDGGYDVIGAFPIDIVDLLDWPQVETVMIPAGTKIEVEVSARHGGLGLRVFSQNEQEDPVLTTIRKPLDFAILPMKRI